MSRTSERQKTATTKDCNFFIRILHAASRESEQSLPGL
jgi:hypothetical protein